MVEYYGHNDWRDYHLSHHGVLGMHWGIRRYQPYGVGYQRKGGETGKVTGEARRYNKIEKKITRLSSKQAKVQAKADKYRAKSRSPLGRLTEFGNGWNETQYRKQKKADRIGRKINRLEKKADKLKGQSYGSQDKAELKRLNQEAKAEAYKVRELNLVDKKYDNKFSRLEQKTNRLINKFNMANSDKKIDKLNKKLASTTSKMWVNRAMKEVEKSKVMNYSVSDISKEKALVGAHIAGAVLTTIGSNMLAYGVGSPVAFLSIPNTNKYKTMYRTKDERGTILEKGRQLRKESYETASRLTKNDDPHAEARRILDKVEGKNNGSASSAIKETKLDERMYQRKEQAADDVRSNKRYDYNDYSDRALAAELMRNGKNPSDNNIKKYRNALKRENAAYEKSMNYNEVVRDFHPEKYNQKTADRYEREYDESMKRSRKIIDEMDDVDY